MAPSLRVRNDRGGLVARTLAAVDRLDGSFIRFEAGSHVTLDQERRQENRERERLVERERLDGSVDRSYSRGAELDEAPDVSGKILDPRVSQPSVRIRRIPEQWGPRSQRTDGTQPSVSRQDRTPSQGSRSNSGPIR